MRKIKDRRLITGKTALPFQEALRSPFTKESYERRLITFMGFVRLSIDEFVSRAKKDPAWAQKTVGEYMLLNKRRVESKEIQASSLRSLMKPIRLLLEMNDVTGINWKKISRMMPPARRYALDRAPTIDEMRHMISESDLRFQAILLTMASSGIRLGAWDYLDCKHLEPIHREGRLVAGKLTVYAGEPEEYFTFVTPEAYTRLEKYSKFREAHGEIISGESPLVRDKWKTAGKRGRNLVGEVGRAERLRSAGVKRLFEDTMWRLGFRKEKKRRHEFSIHSVRKYFKTRAEQVMKPINVETLLDHSTGISDSYYRPTEIDLLDDYLKAVPLLTISEVEEVRRNSQLSQEQLETRVEQLEALVTQLAAEKGRQVLALGQNHKPDI